MFDRNINIKIDRLIRKMEAEGLEDDPVYQDRLDDLYAERDHVYESTAPNYRPQIELGKGGFGT
jgi:hypothetical protein